VSNLRNLWTIAEGGKGPYPDMELSGSRVWGAVAAATWFESLAVASRPLQRRLAETDFEFPFDFARIISRL